MVMAERQRAVRTSWPPPSRVQPSRESIGVSFGGVVGECGRGFLEGMSA